MVTKKPKGLGLGLEALLGPKVSDTPRPAGDAPPATLKLAVLQPGKYQPRTRMDEGSLYELAESIKAQGVTMIWIEHVVHALLSIADRLFVINFGQRLAEGEPRAVMADAQVRRVYMGMEA
mgnify:CR=1 FL=1